MLSDIEKKIIVLDAKAKVRAEFDAEDAKEEERESRRHRSNAEFYLFQIWLLLCMIVGMLIASR